MFGISLPTVDAWLRLGCPYDQEGARGREWVFDTADVVRWREAKAKADASGNDQAGVDELKRRKLLAETRMAELELAKAASQVADLGAVERAWTRVCAEVMTNLRGSFVARCETQLLGETDADRIRAVLLAEVDAVLEGLADLDVLAADEEEADEVE